MINIILLISTIVFKSATITEQPEVWDRIDEKVNWFKINGSMLSTNDPINSDFVEFYDVFISDSVYQKKHIKFPCLAVIGSCESTEILNNENWNFITQQYNAFFEDDRYEHLIISNDSIFFMQSTLIEVAIISQIGFEKIDKEWYLTLLMVNEC